MTQEAIRVRAGEDDRVDVRIAVRAINQLFQLLGHRGIEQRMRASVETGDEHAGVAFDGDVPFGLRAAPRRVHVIFGESVAVDGCGHVSGDCRLRPCDPG